MWAQKKRHGNDGGTNNNVGIKLAVPKLRGVGDIDALLAQSQSNDELEKQDKKLGSGTDVPKGDSCGCGW